MKFNKLGKWQKDVVQEARKRNAPYNPIRELMGVAASWSVHYRSSLNSLNRKIVEYDDGTRVKILVGHYGPNGGADYIKVEELIEE